MSKLKHIPELVHIDHCDLCCMDAWRGKGKGATVIGWQPAPIAQDFSPLAIVCVCPTCGRSWWTHYAWIPVPEDMLPAEARRLLKLKG